MMDVSKLVTYGKLTKEITIPVGDTKFKFHYASPEAETVAVAAQANDSIGILAAHIVKVENLTTKEVVEIDQPGKMAWLRSILAKMQNEVVRKLSDLCMKMAEEQRLLMEDMEVK